MLATAYENGQIAGELTIYALIIAGGVRLIDSLRHRPSRAVNAAGVVLMVVLALVTITGHGASPSVPAAARTSDAAYLEGARRDMIAGCSDKGAPRSYCECIADRMLEASGHDARRWRRLMAELRPDTPPPAALMQAARACAKPRAPA